MSLINNNPLIDNVHVTSPVNINYTNKGNALVRHVLSIDDDNPTTPPVPSVINDWQGYLAKGQYDCILTSCIFTAGALGRLCDSTIMINGQLVAIMKHAVPANSDRDTILTYFTISVS